MEKTAAKTYKDPVLNRLIQNKANWNRQVSALINDLIHFKKSMNGWPSKFYKERSRITQPVPVDLASVLGKMTGEFQEIASQGNSIIQQQAEFARSHVKRKSDQTLNRLEKTRGPEAVTPKPPATPDLSQQLGKGASNQGIDYFLISEASNPLSRFFQRLLNPGIGFGEAARMRKYRLSLLTSALQIYRDLKGVQKAIVGSGPQSIFEASQLLNRVEDNMVFMVSGLQVFSELYPAGPADKGDELSTPAKDEDDDKTTKTLPPVVGPDTISVDPKIQDALQAVQDFQANGNIKGVVGMPALRDLAKKFIQAPPENRLAFANDFLAGYRQMLLQISANKQIPPANSFAEIIAATKTSVASAPEQLQVVAQNLLGKWKHQLSPFDKTSAFRLDIYRLADESRKVADQIMDHLKTDINAASMSKLTETLAGNILKMRTLMRGLGVTTRGLGYQPNFMNLLEGGHLSDYDIKLDPKQKQRLEKMLRHKQLQDLTKMYSRR